METERASGGLIRYREHTTKHRVPSLAERYAQEALCGGNRKYYSFVLAGRKAWRTAQAAKNSHDRLPRTKSPGGGSPHRKQGGNGEGGGKKGSSSAPRRDCGATVIPLPPLSAWAKERAGPQSRNKGRKPRNRQREASCAPQKEGNRRQVFAAVYEKTTR